LVINRIIKNFNFLKKNINKKTKAIIFGDFFGNILNLDKIKKLCKNKKIIVRVDLNVPVLKGQLQIIQEFMLFCLH